MAARVQLGVRCGMPSGPTASAAAAAKSRLGVAARIVAWAAAAVVSILALRMNSAANGILSVTQAAFVSSHDITDNVLFHLAQVLYNGFR